MACLIVAAAAGAVASLATAEDPPPGVGVTASFTFEPSSPATGETVTFTSTSSAFPGSPVNAVETEEWDLDNDGVYETSGHTAQRSFATAGTYTIGLRAADGLGNQNTTSQGVTVANRRPTAAFTVSPNPASTGQTVNFDASGSSDPDGTIEHYEWDFDGNGSFETDTGTDATVSRSYASAQSLTIGLRVVDNDGADDSTTRSLTISNRDPTAAFTISPNPALTGQTVNFDASGSSDPDDGIKDYRWDLDGNGTFETDSGIDPTVSRSFASPAVINVGLRVFDKSGADDIVTHTLTVNNRLPTATFTVSPNPALTGETIGFDASDSSDPDGTIANYKWDLDGNGTFETDTGTTSETSRAYDDDAVLTIRLQVTDDRGATRQTSRTLTVNNRAPSASFTVSPNPALTGQTVSFDGSASSDPDGTIAGYEWDLDGNGSFETDTNGSATTSHAYGTSGTFTVKLRVTDDDGKTNVTSRSLTINDRPNQLPTASFTASPNPVITGQTVSFDASASSDPDGTIANYKWDLDGDGTFETNTNTTKTASRSYSVFGTVTVRLLVTDDKGGTAQTSRSVTVHAPPVPSFTATPAPALTGQTVSFDASASSDPDGTIANYRWDLDGNGSFETNTNTTKTASTSYTTPGTVTVRLQVTDNDGHTGQTTRTVTIHAPPVASFTATPSSALVGQTVNFDASPSSDPDGTIANYKWDLDGDGTFETNGNTTKTTSRSYPTPGTVAVGLQVTDNHGHTAQTTRNVAVHAPPVARFTLTPATPLVGQAVTFDGSTSSPGDAGGTITNYRWDLDGNGSFETDTGSSATTPPRQYSAAGTLNLRLRVTDNNGNVATAVQAVTINSRVVNIDFDFTPASPESGDLMTFTGTASATGSDNGIKSIQWDFSYDSVNFNPEASGPSVQRSFATPGRYLVAFRAIDNFENKGLKVRTIQVGDRPPSPSFTFFPTAATAGDVVTFVSTATDPDSSITDQRWDLNGDGAFDDAAGSTASRSFDAAGSHTVSLQVTDNFGKSAIATETVTVAARPPAPPPTVTIQSPSLLSPFPVVRISGTARKRGTFIRRLTVLAPVGAKVVVRCRGRRCPVKRSTYNASTRKAKVLRIRRFEKRLLRPGIRLEIRIVRSGLIGKYTRFKIRKARPPIRIDRCLMPNSTKPVQCPNFSS